MWQQPFLATVATLTAEMQMGNATAREVSSPTITMFPTTMTMLLSKEVKIIQRLMKMRLVLGKRRQKQKKTTKLRWAKCIFCCLDNDNEIVS